MAPKEYLEQHVELTAFEKQILDALTEGSHAALRTLRSQVAASDVVDRELTGAGCYTELRVDPSVPSLEGAKETCCFGDVHADMDGVIAGAGFLLWLERGRVASLESYTYGEERWPDQPRLLRWRHQYDEHTRAQMLLRQCITRDDAAP